ncbi:YlmH/Sll1252 family protein [Apilactobacillus apisilvae]|uniref:YlmH/Sll1252 family protein n=1 Tax=Apilactobacillus apisilvae TaxID=2923364 RepID=A0ABY4PJ52_9LACO|nr:YlmH/Sll1252 family protein [Apilactobacillus apisilvae]UQS85543.1 YlmH/Sll1252 family protein [Apilactobacillus apisilvae]
MNNNVKQHFRKEESSFVDSSDDLANDSINQYRPILTKFLNPREIYILKTVVNSYSGLNISTFGGYYGSEMKRAILYPEYFSPEQEDFNVVAFNIDYPEKFSNLKHSKVLGTLMGSGIDRSTIGDILTDGCNWQFLCTKEISEYLQMSLDRIGKIKVSIQKISLDNIITPENDWEERHLILSSFRVDNIISTSFHISRNDAKTLVNHNKVHLNWTLHDHPDTEMSVNDVISVRRYGRVKLESKDGETKKGKSKAFISILKK